MSDPIKVKAPFFAFILSLIIPGFGQFYNGKVASGIVFFLIATVAFWSIFIGIGLVLFPLVCIVAAFSAYSGAKKANARFQGQVSAVQSQKH